MSWADWPHYSCADSQRWHGHHQRWRESRPVITTGPLVASNSRSDPSGGRPVFCLLSTVQTDANQPKQIIWCVNNSGSSNLQWLLQHHPALVLRSRWTVGLLLWWATTIDTGQWRSEAKWENGGVRPSEWMEEWGQVREWRSQAKWVNGGVRPSERMEEWGQVSEWRSEAKWENGGVRPSEWMEEWGQVREWRSQAKWVNGGVRPSERMEESGLVREWRIQAKLENGGVRPSKRMEEFKAKWKNGGVRPSEWMEESGQVREWWS